MPFIRKSLLQLVFSGSFMKRWNDRLRPMELVEVDKQAHKMFAAFLLYTLAGRGLPEEERLALGEQIVEGGLFDYLYRLVITDIKPPVFYQIKANPAHYQKLTKWVLSELRPRITPLGRDFWSRMQAWLMDPSADTPARRILEAAHMYASHAEFKLLKPLNPPDEEMAEIERGFVERLASFEDIPGVRELSSGEENVLKRLARLCGQLRYQKRWSQTPRIPETSVLGHMYIVAAFAWFFSLETEACRARRLNNFFIGLLHDLPELLTRDIISPVKRADPVIGDLIKQYEDKELDRLVYSPLVGEGYTDVADRLGYLLGRETGSEFAAAVREDGRVRPVDTEDLAENYNEDRFDPRDGELLKMCDHLAAFMEAYTTLRNGITSDQLRQALWRIGQTYQQDHPVVAGIHIGSLLADFD